MKYLLSAILAAILISACSPNDYQPTVKGSGDCVFITWPANSSHDGVYCKKDINP